MRQSFVRYTYIALYLIFPALIAYSFSTILTQYSSLFYFQPCHGSILYFTHTISSSFTRSSVCSFVGLSLSLSHTTQNHSICIYCAIRAVLREKGGGQDNFRRRRWDLSSTDGQIDLSKWCYRIHCHRPHP